MAYKAVIFDLFGTLVQTVIKTEYHNHMGEIASILEIAPKRFLSIWDGEIYTDRNRGRWDSFRDVLGYITDGEHLSFPDKTYKTAERVRHEFVGRMMTSFRAETLETLDAIQRKGAGMALISDCSPEVPVLWDHNPLKTYFPDPVFSCEVRMKKPDPAIFAIAREQLGLKAEECLYVGDGGSNELEGATNAGLKALLIRSDEDEKKQAYRPEESEWKGQIIRSLLEILPLI